MMRRTALAAVVAAAIGLGMGGSLVLPTTAALAQTADQPVPAEDTAATTAERAEAVGLEQHPEHGAEGGGMPQLDASTFASQILWLIITFSALYYLLRTRALPRVADILETRQERISNDLDKAASLRAEAEAAYAEYETVLAQAQAQASDAIKATRDAATADIAQRTAALDAELSARIHAAEAAVAKAKAEALGELETVAVEAAQVATQRLTGVEVTIEEARAALAAVRKEVA